MEDANSRTLHCTSFLVTVVLKGFCFQLLPSLRRFEKNHRDKRKSSGKPFYLSRRVRFMSAGPGPRTDYTASQAISKAGLSFSLSLFPPSTIASAQSYCRQVPMWLLFLLMFTVSLSQGTCTPARSLGPVVARSSVNHTVKKRSQCYIPVSYTALSSLRVFAAYFSHANLVEIEYFKLKTIFPDELKLKQSQ